MNGPTEELSRDEALEALHRFFRETPFIFFGTGMSCAVDTCFGMPALQNCLTSTISERDLQSEEVKQWRKFQDRLAADDGLEAAMDVLSIGGLIERITTTCAEFIGSKNREHCHKISLGETSWPAGGLIKKILQSVPPSAPELHVLTPNYDLLCETAFDELDISYTCGFSGELERRLDWQRAKLQFLAPKAGSKMRIVQAWIRHVRLYKVHGSLNFFFHRQRLIQNNAWIYDPPIGAQRVMVTPGQSKYRVLQKFREELQQPADAAIKNASSFLFLGYGFNDGHLEEYINRKLVQQKAPALVITRDCNPRIQNLALKSDGVWVVSMANESGLSGTRIFNSNYIKPLFLPGEHLWRADIFTKTVLGE